MHQSAVQGKLHHRHPTVHVVGSEKTGFIVWRMSPLMLTTGTCWLICGTISLFDDLLTLIKTKWVTCTTSHVHNYCVILFHCRVCPSSEMEPSGREWVRLDNMPYYYTGLFSIYVCLLIVHSSEYAKSRILNNKYKINDFLNIKLPPNTVS